MTNEILPSGSDLLATSRNSSRTSRGRVQHGDPDAIERLRAGGVFVDGGAADVGPTVARRMPAWRPRASIESPVTSRRRRHRPLIVDWAIRAPLGRREVDIETATDVRRGEDGIWRYVIDNPFERPKTVTAAVPPL